MVMREQGSDVLVWRGVKMTRRAVQSLRWVEEKSGVKIDPAQGSFNRGVAASGGTHDEEALDCRVRGLGPQEIKSLVHWLRRAGWAAWYRSPAEGNWGPHVHCVPLGRNAKRSYQAQWQADQYDAGRSGLSSNRADSDPFRPKPKRSWSFRLGRWVPRV